MATPPPVTDTLARFVTETNFSSISEETQANAKLHILDTLGVALAGSKTAVADITIDYCTKLGASSEASIWGTKAKASVSSAAFANGLLSHALDYDDWDAFIHVGHPSSMLVGAAVPLAEHFGASGKELLKPTCSPWKLSASWRRTHPTYKTAAFTVHRCSAVSAPPSRAPAC